MVTEISPSRIKHWEISHHLGLHTETLWVKWLLHNCPQTLKMQEISHLKAERWNAVGEVIMTELSMNISGTRDLSPSKTSHWKTQIEVIITELSMNASSIRDLSPSETAHWKILGAVLIQNCPSTLAVPEISHHCRLHTRSLWVHWLLAEMTSYTGSMRDISSPILILHSETLWMKWLLQVSKYWWYDRSLSLLHMHAGLCACLKRENSAYLEWKSWRSFAVVASLH